MLLIDNAVVAQVLTMRDCIAVQEKAFGSILDGQAISRPRIDTFVPCDREDGYYRFGSVEGASGGYYAVRLKSDILTWPQRPDGGHTERKHCVVPGTYCGLVLLFSSKNGEPLAIINDGHLQHMRVGGAAGIGAKLLARTDARVLGVVGSGGMARTVTEAIAVVRQLDRVQVFSPDEGRRQAFAAEMSKALDIAVEPVGTAEAAVTGSDIVATCTDSMKPVISADWLSPGTHLVNIGPKDLGPDTEARIDHVVRQGTETLDIPESDTYRKGIGHSRGGYVAGDAEQRARLPKKSGRASGYRADWPLYVDVVSGKAPGRTSREQITQYRPVGNWGIQFSSVGGLVYEQALERGLGRGLPTEWFLQTIKN